MTWQSVPFGEVFEIQLGKMLDDKKNVGEFHPYLANRNVQWGKCALSNLGEMRFTDADRRKFDLRDGDLLVCEGGEVGRTAIWTGELQDCYYQKAVHRLRSTGDVEPRFVLHYMRWAALRNLFARLTSTTSIAHLTKAKLQKVTLPLPPLAEQKRIAGILDAADALRAKRRESLAQLDTLLRSTFLDMFGDPVTNPMGWEIVTVENAPLHIGDGNYSSKYPKASDFVPKGVPFIRANNIVGNTVTDADMRFISVEQHAELKKGHLLAGDVLITTRGDVGQVAVVPREFDGANINAQLVLLRPTNSTISTRYLCHLFAASSMRQKVKSVETGVALKQLPIRTLKKISLIIPPLNLQHRFAAIVESVEQQKASQRAHLDELDTLFASLQSRAFRRDL